jgi:hypothetical protein
VDDVPAVKADHKLSLVPRDGRVPRRRRAGPGCNRQRSEAQHRRILRIDAEPAAPDRKRDLVHISLIQLLPKHAADLLGLPMTPDRNARAVQAFASMSADEQLDYVEAYLDEVLHGRGAGNLRDAYMAVFYPSAVGQGDGYVIAREGGESAFGRAVYRQNAGLDANGDGVITAVEAARRVGGLRG